MKDSNIKIVTEVKKGNIELVVHMAYLMGFCMSSSGKKLTHPDVKTEIDGIKTLLNEHINKLS